MQASWPPAAASYDPSFWIDMTPYHADPANYGAEHNFRIKANGSVVDGACKDFRGTIVCIVIRVNCSRSALCSGTSRCLQSGSTATLRSCAH